MKMLGKNIFLPALSFRKASGTPYCLSGASEVKYCTRCNINRLLSVSWPVFTSRLYGKELLRICVLLKEAFNTERVMGNIRWGIFCWGEGLFDKTLIDRDLVVWKHLGTSTAVRCWSSRAIGHSILSLNTILILSFRYCLSMINHLLSEKCGGPIWSEWYGPRKCGTLLRNPTQLIQSLLRKWLSILRECKFLLLAYHVHKLLLGRVIKFTLHASLFIQLSILHG